MKKSKDRKRGNRVGLMSLPNYFNYGSQLQLYALQTAIEDMGHYCEVINYTLANPPPLPLASRLVNLALHPYRFPIGLGERLYKRHVRARAERGNELSAAFQAEFIRMVDHRFSRPEELANDPPEYDAYVVGSDQVWSPLGRLGDTTFFLSFAAPDRRIAYAPSLGVSKVSPEAISWLQEGLAGIRYLSVREATGARLIKELSGRDAEVVVDPSLLLPADRWLSLRRTMDVPKHFVLMYALCGDGYVRKFCHDLARHLDCPIVVLPKHPKDVLLSSSRMIKAYDVGPLQFLDLMSRALAVVTDSFHGTVFSILFRRRFFSFRRYEDVIQSVTFSRIADLLKRLGLIGRIVSRDSMNRDFDEPIDYDSAHAALGPWVAQSRGFLQDSLRSVLAQATTSSTVTIQARFLTEGLIDPN